LFAGGVALAGLAVSGLSKGIPLDHMAVVWGVLALWIMLLLLQMNAEYRRRTYDPTWVLRFSNEFDSDVMKRTRSRASRFLKDNKERLTAQTCASPDVDDLLDFFETLGFFMQGDQMTAEAIHHAFYYWIQGYYSAIEKYLKRAREDESTCWEFVEMLFDMTNQIERERVKNRHKVVALLDDEETEQFLKEEIALQPASSASLNTETN